MSGDSGHLDPGGQGSVEISSADGDDLSSRAPAGQDFGDFETDFPTFGATGVDDPSEYDIQIFVIPDGTYTSTMDAMLP